jgi:hypothetical protein
MPRQNQFDRGFAKRLDEIEILFAWNPEDAINAFVLECGDK